MPSSDPQTMKEWQQVVEIMARVMDVPAAIITEFSPPYVEVLKASVGPGNPYSAGQRVKMDSHYCEAVYKKNAPLLVGNAPEDPHWKNAPEIDYGMISYLGYPIHYPTGEVFGTICVLDNKANNYSEVYEQLLERFRNMVEAQLRVQKQKEELEQRLAEIHVLRGLIPICSSCKSVRDDQGYWKALEEYMTRHTDAKFTHSICPKCAKELYPNLD